MTAGKLIVTDARQYRIHDLIAKGAFSEVYRCTAVATGEVYAIKIVNRELALRHHMEDALIREVNAMQVAGSLPHVASLVDKLVSTNNYYIIMNVAEGGTLLDLIRDHAQSSFLRLHTGLYMRQLLLGLAALHARNIVHRDVKPENILLDKERTQVMISDFGFACYAPPGRPLHRTCGTLKYCAPELLRESPSYDGRKVDIWAAGVTLYVMLFRTHPYKSGTSDADALLACIRARPYTLPHEVDPDVRDMLSKMLQVDPEQRWSAEELLRHPWMRAVAETTRQGAAETGGAAGEAVSSGQTGQQWPERDGTERSGDAEAVERTDRRDGEAAHEKNRRTSSRSSSLPAESSTTLDADDEGDTAGVVAAKRGRVLQTIMSNNSSFAPIHSGLTEYVDDGLYMAVQSDFQEQIALSEEKDTASYCFSRATGSRTGAVTPSTSGALRHSSSPLAPSLSTLTMTTDEASSSYLHSFDDEGGGCDRVARHDGPATRSGGEEDSDGHGHDGSSNDEDDDDDDEDGGRTSFMGFLGFCCTALYLARLIGYVMLFWWPLLLMAAARLALGPRVRHLRLPRLVRRVMAALPGPPRRRCHGPQQQPRSRRVSALSRRRPRSAPHTDVDDKDVANSSRARRRGGRSTNKTRSSLACHDRTEDMTSRAVATRPVMAGRKALGETAPTHRASPGLSEDEMDKWTSTVSTEHSAELPVPRHTNQVRLDGTKTASVEQPCSPGVPFPRLRDGHVAEDFPTVLTHGEAA